MLSEGTVKRFFSNSRYGFVIGDDGLEYHLHHDNGYGFTGHDSRGVDAFSNKAPSRLPHAGDKVLFCVQRVDHGTHVGKLRCTVWGLKEDYDLARATAAELQANLEMR